MRTLQRSIKCPMCGQPAMLTSITYLTGDRAGEREFDLRCPHRHAVGQDELELLWDETDADAQPEPV